MASRSTFDGLMPREMPTFSLPPLAAGSRALVIGMGGGCDVFAAVAAARLWESQSPAGATVLSAACIGRRALPESVDSLGPSLFRLPSEPVPLVPGDQGYGTVKLELSAPRGAEGSPFLIIVPESGKSGKSLEEVSATNAEAVCQALAVLRVDQVLAVDLGGDSLTGGADFEGGNFEFGRDRQVLQALGKSGVPFVQLVFGPGVDGESSIEMMRSAVGSADERGALLGAMPLGELARAMGEMARTLAANRTPNLIAQAVELEAADAAARSGGTGEEQEGAEAPLFEIHRHGLTALIPRSWLTVALALKGGV